MGNIGSRSGINANEATLRADVCLNTLECCIPLSFHRGIREADAKLSPIHNEAALARCTGQSPHRRWDRKTKSPPACGRFDAQRRGETKSGSSGTLVVPSTQGR